MKKSRKDIQTTRTNDKSIAARYAPIPDMVAELLAKIDPEGYTRILEDFRARYHPLDLRGHLVEYIAHIYWQRRGCVALETEILNLGVEACAAADDTPGQALARAYMRDVNGPNLLSKLSSYERRLSINSAQCIRLLELRAKNRKSMEAIMATALEKRKPCTSVVQ